MNRLCEKLGHTDRRAGFLEYGRGLMLPIERKSVEPLAARTDPWHVSAKHQSLHHRVAKSDWSDEAVLTGGREWMSPALELEKGGYWSVDDTGLPKKGQHCCGEPLAGLGPAGPEAGSGPLKGRPAGFCFPWGTFINPFWSEKGFLFFLRSRATWESPPVPGSIRSGTSMQ